jgi:hypothetical protein
LTSSQAIPSAATLWIEANGWLEKNVVPPKSLFDLPSPKGRQIRKDSAAYVSLSSYSLFKEPDERPEIRKSIVWPPNFR